MKNHKGKVIGVLQVLKPMKSDKIISYNDSFNNNKVVQTILNHIDVTIHKKSESNVDLYVRRSFAKHLWDWLKDSASLV